MQPALRARYTELKSASAEFGRGVEALHSELDQLASRRAALEDELAVSAVKREAVGLYEQLAAAESARDRLAVEAAERGTPQQERERLLAQVGSWKALGLRWPDSFTLVQ